MGYGQTTLTAATVLFISGSMPALARQESVWIEKVAVKSVSQWVCVNPHGKSMKYLLTVTTDKGTFKSVWPDDTLRAELFKWSDDITPETWEEFKTIVASGQTALLPERDGDVYTRVCAADPDASLTGPETGAANHN